MHIGKRYIVVWASSGDDMANAEYESHRRTHRCQQITPQLLSKVGMTAYDGTNLSGRPRVISRDLG